MSLCTSVAFLNLIGTLQIYSCFDPRLPIILPSFPATIIYSEMERGSAKGEVDAKL